jgi:hypothetical protein
MIAVCEKREHGAKAPVFAGFFAGLKPCAPSPKANR